MKFFTVLVSALCLLAMQAIAQAPPQRASVDDAFFEARVRPVLAVNCYGCHGPEKQANMLRVDSRESLLRGGKRGSALVPEKPEESLLIQAVRHQGLQMPLGGRLEASEIDDLEEWVRGGAPWPAAAVAEATGDGRYERLVRDHWAFQPVGKTPLPEVAEARWSHPADRFIYRALEEKGLSPAEPAERRMLIRRLSYVLTGLPPTAEESDRFAADDSPEAYERWVDRLLHSPRFGEHWARHWLDLVRYGETRGYEWNYEIIGAWRYRDYLIRAFNADVPYDQLVREHIAGDLLEKPRIDSAEQINESMIGTAFYRLGEAGHDDCIKFRGIGLDVMDNQIDTLTKTFQALTVSCARCHDHKMDPIPTEDYYGLYGILNSSRVVVHSIDTPDVYADSMARLRDLKERIREELAKLWLREAKDVESYLARLTPLQGTPANSEDGLDRERLEAWRTVLTCPDHGWGDLGRPWALLLDQTASGKKSMALAAGEIVDRYREEAAERAEFNRVNFETFGDFRSHVNPDWRASGPGLHDGSSDSGEFAVAGEGDRAVSGIFPAGVYTHAISNRLNGALRSPELPKNKKYLSLRAMGGMLGAHRTVIDNCAIGEKYQILGSNRLQWNKLKTFGDQDRLPVFVELITKWENPRIPDRPRRLKGPLEHIDTPTSYFGVVEAVLHDVDEAPREELSHLMRLFEGGPPGDWQGLVSRYAGVIEKAVANWAAGRAADDDALWLDWLVRNDLLSNRADATPGLRRLIDEFRRIEAGISKPRVVEGLADGGPGNDFPVLVGGGPKSFGEPAPRRFLQHFFGREPLNGSGSGRRRLADVLASPDNPLTARVMVNRIWHHVFGRGIVTSVDNFGLLGDRPTHPELLDYLAGRFVEDGWSIKKMIRLIVLSQAFRQAGEATPRARQVDPLNRLLHHFPLRRLEGESLRDSILLMSGKLRDSMFGPSIHPHRAEAKDYRRLFSGPLDGAGRRSIYLKVTRMEGMKFLETFDYPNPLVTRGRRDETNVPAQALTMLNDPFVISEARTCAERLLAQPAGSVEERIDDLFRTALGRGPSSQELERFRGLAARLAGLHQVPREELLSSLTVWKDLAHAVLNLKEFLYVQ
ncbi:MAG: PSD1 and planctomycete cytochrome C domain-containing protein [Bryobacterales bacterium]|nr:PSD1 and planctomycete cytochrome C domain-containing protein [Bryobacterales bacterium]